MRATLALAAPALAVALSACSERTPTSVDRDLLPPLPTSVEIVVPWEQFGSGLAVFGGYGSPRDLGFGVVARAFGGTLDARTLVRLEALPTSVSVTDTAGTTRNDTNLRVTRGRVVAFLDSASAVAPGQVTFQLGILRQRWDPGTASWRMAVDTLGGALAWREPGAGPLEVVGTAQWSRAAGDSVVFALDSAGVERWRDTANVSYGAILATTTPGVRVEVNNIVLRAVVAPSVRPDTLVTITGPRGEATFIYHPGPEPVTPGTIRVGGAPAWRTVLTLSVPRTLAGPASLCAAAGCPLTLTPLRVSYAALVLTTRRTEAAFQPSDSLSVDVRAVFDPPSMPKSPLGESLLGGIGRTVAPHLFGAGEGGKVEIPITGFVRTILQGDSVGGFPPATTIALLSALEPSSFTFASFQGPGTPGAPVLKLIVTATRAVELP